MIQGVDVDHNDFHAQEPTPELNGRTGGGCEVIEYSATSVEDCYSIPRFQMI